MGGQYTRNNKTFQELTVPCYDTDAAFYLKPAAFMDMAQELAYGAAKQLGFGYEDLYRRHTAWVISRMHFHYDHPPRWKDPVILATWHKGQDGLFFLRDFTVDSPEGESLVRATSSWLIIDVETRHLVKDPIGTGILREGTECQGDAIEAHCPKILLPKGAEREFVKEHRVVYSDIDILGHTNNARYLVWAMDCIDYEVTSSRRIKDVYINFNRETLPGERVQLYRTCQETEGRTVFHIEGMADGKASFIVRIEF